jgi:hypothetical protein
MNNTVFSLESAKDEIHKLKNEQKHRIASFYPIIRMEFKYEDVAKHTPHRWDNI